MRTSAGISCRLLAHACLVIAALAMSACSGGRHARHYEPSYSKPSKSKFLAVDDFKELEEPTRRTGIASWYGPGFHEKLTASGEPYDMNELTCAHKTFPLGTQLRVTNISNGKSVVVTINDRGPYVEGREIDLSYAAAKELEIIGPGTAMVDIEPVGRDVRYVNYNKSFSIDKGPFTVQVASFSERFNAVQLIKNLNLRYNDRNPYIFEADDEGKRLYRVRVGKFDTREDAQGLADSLVEDGYKVMVCTYEDQI